MEDNGVVGGAARDWVLRVVLGRDPEGDDPGPPPIAEHPDLLAIDTELERIRADERGPTTILAHQLRVVHRRGVRIAAVRPAPIEHTARLVFADSTVVVIRSDQPHDLPDLAVRLVRGERVHLTRVAPELDAVRLELTTQSRRVQVRATGFDQAD